MSHLSPVGTTVPSDAITTSRQTLQISSIPAVESSALTLVKNPPGEILPSKKAAVSESKHTAFDLEAAEQRAIEVRATLDSVCLKLAELKPQIIELRKDFKRKPKAARIAECKTWTEFCEKKLHRTDRAIQKLLADKPKPKPKPKPPDPQGELSSGQGGAVGDWPTLRRTVEERICADLQPYVADTDFKIELVELLDRIAGRFGLKIIAEKITAEARAA